MTLYLIYPLVGMFAGVIAGLFGVGGGLVIVPVLVFVFQSQGVNPDVQVHLAIGSSLATIIMTSISSTYSHHRRGAVDWPVVRDLAPGILIGALLGAVIADALSSDALSRFFGIFELAVAAYMFFGKKPPAQRKLPGRLGLSSVGTVIGAISSIVGIGGGSLTVPYLVWCGEQAQRAVATAAACGLPIACAGAIGFAITGWSEAALPSGSTGYIYWPAVLGIIVFSMLFAPLGAKLAHHLPGAQLKRYFAIFLALLGIKMLFFS